MKSKNLITKLALIVAVAALLFSIITLIRSIVIGSNVFLSCILVVGTVIITTVCAIMLYVLSRYEDDDELEDGEDSENDEEQEDRRSSASARAPRRPAKKIPRERSAYASAPDEEAADDARPSDDGAEADPADSADIEAEIDRIIADLERESARDYSRFE